MAKAKKLKLKKVPDKKKKLPANTEKTKCPAMEMSSKFVEIGSQKVMSYTELQCPECGYNSFYAYFDKGIGDDPFVYLRLSCQQCKACLHFTLVSTSALDEVKLEPVE